MKYEIRNIFFLIKETRNKKQETRFTNSPFPSSYRSQQPHPEAE